MTKQELIEVVFEKTEGKLKKTECKDLVDLIFDKIAQSLKDGEEVRIPGFGIFKVVDRAEKTCRNPQTGEKMVVPAKKAVKFSVSTTLKKEI